MALRKLERPLRARRRGLLRPHTQRARPRATPTRSARAPHGRRRRGGARRRERRRAAAVPGRPTRHRGAVRRSWRGARPLEDLAGLGARTPRRARGAAERRVPRRRRAVRAGLRRVVRTAASCSPRSARIAAVRRSPVEPVRARAAAEQRDDGTLQQTTARCGSHRGVERPRAGGRGHAFACGHETWIFTDGDGARGDRLCGEQLSGASAAEEDAQRDGARGDRRDQRGRGGGRYKHVLAVRLLLASSAVGGRRRRRGPRDDDRRHRRHVERLAEGVGTLHELAELLFDGLHRRRRVFDFDKKSTSASCPASSVPSNEGTRVIRSASTPSSSASAATAPRRRARRPPSPSASPSSRPPRRRAAGGSAAAAAAPACHRCCTPTAALTPTVSVCQVLRAHSRIVRQAPNASCAGAGAGVADGGGRIRVMARR